MRANRIHPVLVAVFLLWAAQVYALDCSHKPLCPPGTTAQEAVSCDVCCVEGYAIKSPTDPICCPIGTYYHAEMKDCCPDGWKLKPDKMCWVVNDEDPCTCPTGHHQVAAFACCPDGSTLATDNPNCCTKREDGKCCAAWQDHNSAQGLCVPKKPTGLVVR